MVVAGGVIGADGAGGAAAGAGEFGVADGVLSFVRYGGLATEPEEDGTGIQREEETYSRATKPPTARLPYHAESVSAARRSIRHAKGGQAGGGGHAALYCLFISASPATASAPCVPRAILTIRVETLAAHVPRTEVIRTAGEDPRFAGGDIVVQRRCQGCEYGSVGSRRLGEEGQGGDIGREGWEWDVACGCVDAVSCTDQEADYSWQKHGDDRILQNSHSLVAGSRFDSGLIGRNQDDTRCSRQ